MLDGRLRRSAASALAAVLMLVGMLVAAVMAPVAPSHAASSDSPAAGGGEPVSDGAISSKDDGLTFEGTVSPTFSLADSAGLYGFVAVMSSPDGKTAYVRQGGHVYVVDVLSRTVRTEITFTSSMTGDVSLSDDGSRLYVVDAGTVKVFDTASMKQVGSFGSRLTMVVVSEDGQTAYAPVAAKGGNVETGPAQYDLYSYDIASGRGKRLFALMNASVSYLPAFSSKTGLIYAYFYREHNQDSAFGTINVKTGDIRVLKTASEGLSADMSLELSDDGGTLAYISGAKQVTVIDVRTGERRVLDMPFTPQTFALSRTGKRLVVSNNAIGQRHSDGRVEAFDLSKGVAKAETVTDAIATNIIPMMIEDDRNVMYGGMGNRESTDGEVQQLNLNTGRQQGGVLIYDPKGSAYEDQPYPYSPIGPRKLSITQSGDGGRMLVLAMHTRNDDSLFLSVLRLPKSVAGGDDSSQVKAKDEGNGDDGPSIAVIAGICAGVATAGVVGVGVILAVRLRRGPDRAGIHARNPHRRRH